MSIPRQLPNIITVVRIFCAPIVLWLLLIAGNQGLDDLTARWIAMVLFVVAIATDGIDGHLARKYDLVSNAGKLLDPIADKALTGVAFVGLSILAELPWWITIVVLVREIGITVYRLMVASSHVVAAAWLGKLKTVAQAVALSLALVPWSAIGVEWMLWVNISTMTLAVVLTIASGLDFIAAEVRGSRAERLAARKSATQVLGTASSEES